MKRCLIFLVLSLSATIAIAQTDESFDAFRKNALNGISHYRDSIMTEYKDFRRRINEDYANFLRGIWKEEKAAPNVPPIKDPTPNPPVVISEEDKNKPIEGNPILVEEEISPIPQPNPQPTPVVPIEEEHPSPVNPPFKHNFIFYGTNICVRLSPNQKFILKSLQPQTMGNAWERLSQDDYNNLIFDCLQIREDLTLCDWAYLKMLNSLSESFLGKDSNEATFLTAYIFCQSGYRIRLGENKGKLYLLVGTPHQLYHHGYFEIDGLNYFVFNENPDNLYVCDVSFEGEQSLSLYIPMLPKLHENLSQKRTIKSERFPNITVTSQVNKNIIDFFNEYPTSCLGENHCTRWAMYAETPVCTPAEISVIEALRAKIKGLTEIEALNEILNFVQTGFVYEYDDKVWGGDRAFFADESLYYAYCDCEDRSILFSRLVRNLLGLKVMLVYYPGHLATAVKMKGQYSGDYIIYNNQKFIVCDPTYIGAPVGATMPDMDNQKAKVIVLKLN